MTKMMYAGCFAAAVCAVAVGVASRSSHSTSDVAASLSRVESSRATMQPTAAATTDEVQPLLIPASDDAPRSAEKVDAGEQVSAELLAQRQEAQQAIELLMSSGVWGNEQRMSFYQQLSMLPPDQAAHAVRELLVAFNEGRMQMTTVGPPL